MASQVSEVLTKIAKIDPSFDKEEFLTFCETDIIPNVLEANYRADLEVLKDWCFEQAYKRLAPTLEEDLMVGYSTIDSRVIDVAKVEMVGGQMMEHGPCIIITFQAYVIEVTKNLEGKVIKGDPDKPIRLTYAWVLCRDMEELNPAAAWKVLEINEFQRI